MTVEFTDEAWAAVLKGLVSGWPDAKPLAPSVEETWRDWLSELPPTAVLAAIKSLALEGRPHRPVVGEIYRRAVELGLGMPDFGEIWREITAAVSRFGRYYDGQGGVPAGYRWCSPLVPELIRETGGWNVFADATIDSVRTLESQCRRRFDELCRRELQRHLYATIPGDLPGLRHGDARRLESAS